MIADSLVQSPFPGMADGLWSYKEKLQLNRNDIGGQPAGKLSI